jgi:hypothetical protein
MIYSLNIHFKIVEFFREIHLIMENINYLTEEIHEDKMVRKSLFDIKETCFKLAEISMILMKTNSLAFAIGKRANYEFLPILDEIAAKIIEINRILDEAFRIFGLYSGLINGVPEIDVHEIEEHEIIVEQQRNQIDAQYQAITELIKESCESPENILSWMSFEEMMNYMIDFSLFDTIQEMIIELEKQKLALLQEEVRLDEIRNPSGFLLKQMLSKLHFDTSFLISMRRRVEKIFETQKSFKILRPKLVEDCRIMVETYHNTAITPSCMCPRCGDPEIIEQLGRNEHPLAKLSWKICSTR